MRTLLLLLFVISTVMGFERVPKQYALEVGGVYSLKDELSNAKSAGAIIMFDYAWQLSGLDGSRPKSFISVPIGYTYFTEEPTVSILSYGWTVRHDLLKERAVIPFLGYGLLLNQYNYELDKGKIFGHQTRFDFGCEWRQDEQLHLFAKAEYSMARFPDKANGGSDWIHSVALKFGARLCKPVRNKKGNTE